MAGEWSNTKLGDVTVWMSGGTPSKNQQSYWSGDIPWISASSMKSTRLTDSDLKITKAGLESGSRLADRDFVLLLVRGSELHKRIPIGIAGRAVAFNQDVKALKSKEGLLPSYLLYWLLGNEKTLLSKVEHTGIGAGKLDTDLMKRLPFQLPSLAEQRAIAHILGTMDDKIELNRRMNETLEALARAIFKSWFVDFDPVRANAESRDPGLPEHIADLFPDRFEDSELGEIPVGWSAGKVDEDFDVTMGQSPPGNTYNEAGDGLPFYQGRRDFGFRYPALRVYCNAPKRTAQSGDALVSVRAPVGDVNMAEVSCCIGRGVAAVRHKTGSRSYTYYAMQALKAYFDHFESDGTVFGSVSKSGFAAIPFLIPASKLVEKFESIAFPIDQLIEINEQETRTLTAIRDTLLPRLISGELPVKEAERFRAEAES